MDGAILGSCRALRVAVEVHACFRCLDFISLGHCTLHVQMINSLSTGLAALSRRGVVFVYYGDLSLHSVTPSILSFICHSIFSSLSLLADVRSF